MSISESMAIAPELLSALRDIEVALQHSDTDRAIVLAEEALARGQEHPLILNLSAFGLERRGRFADSLLRLQRALALAPSDALILTAIGRTFSALAFSDKALTYFEAALSFAPGHAPAHHGRGLALTTLTRSPEGRDSHLCAAELDPNYPDPLGALAELALSDGDPAQARALAERALRLEPSQPSATLVLAVIEAEAGDRASALQRIEGLLATDLSPLHRAAADQFYAEQLDIDRPEEAFAAYSRANGLVRSIYKLQLDRPEVETGSQLCARLSAYFAKAKAKTWTAAPGQDDPAIKGHVFLVGFVRSGTTLLEQVLASHPDIVALEEQATLRAIAPPFFADTASLDRLAHLDAAEADDLRRDYWRRVRSFGVEPEGKVFVDKAPLSALWLPFVAKLFPQAKVVFARRDPRDVVVSSFRHRFLVGALTWAFTDLEETAQFYSALMGLAEIYQTKLATPIYAHRHEDLIANFDAEAKRICTFLDLPWTDAMRAFVETAERRDIRTPSASQVRQGLSQAGLGRWRRYGAAVEPILPILAPWVERFGYALD